MKIRKAKAEEAQALLELHARSVRGTCADDYTPQQIQRWLSRQKLSRYVERIRQDGIFICVNDVGKIVGLCSRKGGDIHGLYVDAQAQGRGVGSILLAHMENAARNEGIAELTATSTITALPFYLRHGYEALETTKWPSDEQDALDAVQIRKDLRHGSRTCECR